MRTLTIMLTGMLTPDQLKTAFGTIEPALKAESGKVGLVVHCLGMNGYEMAARSAFVEWNKKWKHKVARVGIVTDKKLWHMVISVMALVSSQKMSPFDTVEAARRWASGKA